MCGIFGLISSKPLSEAQKKGFTLGLLLTQTRGIAASGLFTFDQDCKILGLEKETYYAGKFIKTTQYDKLLSNDNIYGIVGHSRSPTRGINSRNNAHPYRVGTHDEEIALVHNGTLDIKPNEYAYDETDSLQLARRIQRVGYEGVKDFLGPMALAWVTPKNRSLSLFRNYQRPLFFVNTGHEFVFGSELFYLEAFITAVGRNTPLKDMSTLLEHNVVNIVNVDGHLEFENIKVESGSNKYLTQVKSVPSTVVSPATSTLVSPLIDGLKIRGNTLRFHVGTGANKIKIRGILDGPASFPYMSQLNAGGITVQKEKRILVDLEDFFATAYSKSIRIVGAITGFPAEFVCYSTKFTEKDLFEATGLEGTIKTIRANNAINDTSPLLIVLDDPLLIQGSRQ